MLNDLFRRRDVPDGQRALAAMSNGSGKYRLTLYREGDRLQLFCCCRVLSEKGDRQWWLQDSLGVVTLEEQESAEHVLVGLKIK